MEKASNILTSSCHPERSRGISLIGFSACGNGFTENNLAPEDRDKLHKILRGQDPSEKEMSKEELATRLVLETQLQKFISLPFSMSELAEQQNNGSIQAEHRHLADLINLIVRNKKCRPDVKLLAEANAQGFCVKIQTYEVQLQNNNIPIFALFKGERLVCTLPLEIHYSGSFPLHLHNDSPLWEVLKVQIKPNTSMTTIGSPSSSHMLKAPKAQTTESNIGTGYKCGKL